MKHAARLGILWSLAFTALAHAGSDDVRPANSASVRREFRQSKTYPYVFEPVSYLENGEPVPLQFGPAAEDCSHRNAPALPANASGAAKVNDSKQSANTASMPAAAKTKTVAAATVETPAQEDHAESAAYPPPAAAAPAQASTDDGDFTKIPDEVVTYFKDPYIIVKGSHRFTDPIFEPAKMQSGPKSSATYQVQK